MSKIKPNIFAIGVGDEVDGKLFFVQRECFDAVSSSTKLPVKAWHVETMQQINGRAFLDGVFVGERSCNPGATCIVKDSYLRPLDDGNQILSEVKQTEIQL